MRPQYLLAFLFAASLWSNAAQVVRCQEYRRGQYVSKTSLFGVTYSPFALNSDNMCLPTSKVASDMKIIRSVADHVRLYNLAVCPDVTEAVLSAAERDGIRMIIGLYLSANLDMNSREVVAVKPIVKKYGKIIDAVIVGNEVLFSEALTLDALIQYVHEVKAIVKKSSDFSIPVTTADVWPVYESAIGKRLVDATDFLCMNMQPFWEGWDVSCPTGVDYACASAGRYVHAKAEGLEGYFGKPVWICEAGWPTAGERCCQGRPHAHDGLLAGPSEANTTIFIADLVEDARRAQRPTYVHAIFDEDWKRVWAPCGTCEGLSTLLEDPSCTTCELDYHFGIYTFQRTQKRGVTLPDPVTVIY